MNIFRKNNKKILFFVLIILLIIFLLFYNHNYEKFILKNNNSLFELKDYENVKINNEITDLSTVMNINNIDKVDNIIIHIVNGYSGFGSQLTLFMHMQSYINNINKNIICLPHFSLNSQNFKYHDDNYNNSFFIYFKRKIDIENLQNYKQYFVNTKVLDNYPFFEFSIPVISNLNNKKYIYLFIENFYYIKNKDVIKNINDIKLNNIPLYGIHIRSIRQKQSHDNNYLSISLKDRLINLKKKIEDKNNNYNIFIATDVNMYIDLSKEIFNNINIEYINNIERINSEEDSIPNINIKGYKVGSDILNECYALSMCDKIYVSNSNIPYIISIMNPLVDMEEY